MKLLKLFLVCLITFFVTLSCVNGEKVVKAFSAVDVSRDKVVEGLDELRQKIIRPETQVVAKARGMTFQQYFVEHFRELVLDDSLAEFPLPHRELSGVWLWARVDSKSKQIRGLYSSLIRSLQGWGDPELYSSEWDSIAHAVMPMANDTFEYIHRSVIDGMLYKLIQREYEENLCNIQQSPMQLLYNLYNSLQISQLKAYTLMQFSWLYRKTTNESFSYDEESRFMKDLYLSRLSKQAEVAKDAMTKVSQALWRCDPREHVEDETYTSLTHFLQGFILNEVDMNSEITCREDCPFYKYTKQYGCYKGNYCAKQPTCRGNVVNCKFLDSDMWVCPGDYKKSKRRYDWIKYENGRTLGQVDGSCKRTVDKVDSWWRWLFWHCSFCFCLCDESENINSDRYFSLSPTLSDVKNNRVLTGLKFVKKNQVIYIEGQEGELRPNGEINATSIRWIPLKTVNPHSSENIEGLEYYKMSWNQRAVDLDDLEAPPGHVLTGVKWRKVGGHLNFEIQACRWNFTTGILTQGGLKCQWISNDNTDASLQNPRKKIYLNAPDVPTKIRVPSRIDSKTDEFVEFTHTDMDADVAQTAVPFLDIQPVVPEPPVPLIGAGIYHKGMYKSGGYIAPKVFTLDYTQHIQTDFNAI